MSVLWLFCVGFVLYRFLPFFQGYLLFGEDLLFQNIPAQAYTSHLLRQGTMPYWTDNLFAGFPLFAEGQAGVLYPLHLLSLFGDPLVIFHILLLLHLFLAIPFSFLFFSRFLKSPLLQCVGTTIYLELLFDLIHFTNLFELMTWAPLALTFFLKWVSSNRSLYFLPTLCAFALASLTFHTEGIFYLYLLALGFALPFLRAALPRLLLLAGTAFLLGSWQYLPHLELLSHAQRTLENLSSSSLTLSLSFKSFQSTGFGFVPGFQLVVAWVLLFFLLSLFAPAPRHLTPYRFAFFFLALLAFGATLPGYAILSKILFPLRQIRNPHRFFTLVAYLFALVLACRQVEALRKPFSATALLLFLFALAADSVRAPIQKTQESFLTLSHFQDRTLKPKYFGRVNLLFWVPRRTYAEGAQLLEPVPSRGNAGRWLMTPGSPLSHNLALLYNFSTLTGYTPLYTRSADAFLKKTFSEGDRGWFHFGVRYALGEKKLDPKYWRQVQVKQGIRWYVSKNHTPLYTTEKKQAVRVLSFQPQTKVFLVKSRSRDLLLLPLAFYPGWRVTVNGKNTPFFLEQGYGFAIPLPHGRVKIVLRFHSPTILAGALLSSATLLFLLVLACLQETRRKQKPSFQ